MIAYFCRLLLLLALILLSPTSSFAQTADAPAAEAEAPAADAPAAEAPAAEAPGYGAIADLLEDEAARTALIAELRRLAAETAETGAAPAEDISIARQIAVATNAIAETIVVEMSTLYDRVFGTGSIRFSADRMIDFGRAVVEIGVVIAVVVLLLWLLRGAASYVYARASAWVLRRDGLRPWMRRGMAAIGCGLLDLGIVLLAWVAGYLVALFVLGESGRMDTRQSLFLNAFLVVEIVKVVIRLFFATRYDGLRLIPINGEDAAYWNAWLSRLTNLIGYGILVVVPIVAFSLGTAAGNIVKALVYALALILSVLIVRQNREPVRRRLSEASANSHFAFARIALSALARTWHIFAMLYLAVLALMLLLRPQTALGFIVTATLQTIVAVAGGILVFMLISRAIHLGVNLKPDVRAKFPLLEERLNAFVPTTLKIVQVIIAIIVAALILDAWAVFDFFAWVASEAGMQVVGTVATVTFILVAAVLIWLAVSSWIEHRLAVDTDVSRARERTLLTIFRNAFTIALVIMTLMVVLSEIGLDIGPLLAGAGVLGLAIGFGAQKMVQDVITGVFIQLENVMNTGDTVTAGTITGTVEKLTVRSVGIRDLSGTYHVIPFSSVDTVSNFNRGFGYHVGEYGVGYREDTDEVLAVLRQAFEELCADPDRRAKIIGDLEVDGVTALAASSVNVRVRIKTLPGSQWAIGRTFNAIVKKRFDAAGIEMPYPTTTLYFGEDKKGHAPAAPIRLIDEEEEKETVAPAPAAPAPARRQDKPAPSSGPDIPSKEEIQN